MGEGPFWQAPLYPYFLGVIKMLLPDAFFYGARFVQVLMGACVCAMVLWIGRYMFGAAEYLLAALNW